jgi:hypothetical protein
MIMQTNKTPHDETFNPVDEHELPGYQEQVQDEKIIDDYAKRYTCRYAHLAKGYSDTNIYNPEEESRFMYEVDFQGTKVTYSIPVGKSPSIVVSFEVYDMEQRKELVHYDFTKTFEPIIKRAISEAAAACFR